MAEYTPKNWQCGETITAEDLNHMKQGIVEASEGGGGCDCGYECTETSVELFNGSLTTASMGNFSGAQFTPSQPIGSDSVVVTLNGTDYTLPKATGGIYGEADSSDNPTFTNYPCAVGVASGTCYFFTPSNGTYQVVIKSVGVNVSNISPCFAKAVELVLPSATESDLTIFDITQTGESSWTPSISVTEMYEQMLAGHKTYVGAKGEDRFFPMQVYEAGYGTSGIRFGRLIVSGSQVQLEIYAFTNTGGSSHEIMTLSTQ